MIHAQIDTPRLDPLCLWMFEPGDLVTTTERLIDCPLCLQLLPAWKEQLQLRINNLKLEVKDQA